MALVTTSIYGFKMVAYHEILTTICVPITSVLNFMYVLTKFQVSNPWFMAFATVYISSLCQHFYEVLSSGGTIRTWWNEQRMWMIRTVTACLFGCLDVLMKRLGITKASFRLTNKAIDQEKLEKYEKGIFDFQGIKMFMIPLALLIILNLICFIGGVKMVIYDGNFEEMFGQSFLSSFILVLSVPILTGLITKGK